MSCFGLDLTAFLDDYITKIEEEVKKYLEKLNEEEEEETKRKGKKTEPPRVTAGGPRETLRKLAKRGFVEGVSIVLAIITLYVNMIADESDSRRARRGLDLDSVHPAVLPICVLGSLVFILFGSIMMCHAICRSWPPAWRMKDKKVEEEMKHARHYFNYFSKWAFLDSVVELPGAMKYSNWSGRFVIISLWTVFLILGIAVCYVVVETGSDDKNLFSNIALIFVQAMNFNECAGEYFAISGTLSKRSRKNNGKSSVCPV